MNRHSNTQAQFELNWLETDIYIYVIHRYIRPLLALLLMILAQSFVCLFVWFDVFECIYSNVSVSLSHTHARKHQTIRWIENVRWLGHRNRLCSHTIYIQKVGHLKLLLTLILYTHTNARKSVNWISHRIESMKNIINWTLPSVQYSATVTLMQVLR